MSLVILAAIAAGAEILKVKSEYDAYQMQEEALKMQMKQNTIQQNERTLSNYSVLKKALSTQEAQMSVRGVDMTSPSFNAIQRDTINSASKQQKNIDLESSITAENISAEKKAVKNRLYSQLFGDAASLAFNAMGFSQASSKTGSSLPAME